MTENERNPFLIAPPPGLIPAAKPTAAEPVAPMVEPQGLIGLPPGIAESATHRHAPVAPAAAPTTETPVAPATAPQTASPAPATPATPVFVLPDGVRITLSGTTLLGRDPAATGEWVGATLVPVVDPGKSVSKTHAAVTVEAGGIRIHDLNSTNGTVVLRQDGAVDSVQPGTSLAVAPGDTVSLGQFSVVLSG